MSLKYISLEKVLHEKQKYVADISEKLGIDVLAVKHDVFTDTCFEKAGLLNWDAEKIVKSIFLSDASDMYGFIFPELGTFISPQHVSSKNISKVLGISNRQAKKFSNSHCPAGMEWGTCSPFVFDDNFYNPNDGIILDKLFFHEVPDLDNEIVDISIGGTGEKAHKVSVHLPYGAIYDILNYKFGNRIIQKINLF